MKQPHIAFLVNGSPESAMALRANGLSRPLADRFHTSLLYRPPGSKFRGLFHLRRALAALRPDLAYVLDLSAAGALAALSLRWPGGLPVVIDTGDAITALARSAKLRGPAGLAATWLLEEAGLRGASHIVVRGYRHRELLAQRGISCSWIPDGFEADLFFPDPARQASSPLTIGLLGSIIWNGSLPATYGWDLVEILAELPDLPLRGVLIGDGSGLERLRQHAQARGVASRLHFAGRVPYSELRPWLQSFDIALSTQTNDLPGQVRTTGKLPLYLACGCFVLASRVGEAARVLPASMLVDYEGSHDPLYPRRAAAHLRALFAAGLDFRQQGLLVSRQLAPEYEYRSLALRLASLLSSLLDSKVP